MNMDIPVNMNDFDKVRQIKRILIIEERLTKLLNGYITDYILRDKEIDVDELKDTLLFHLEDDLDCLREHR